jgi:fructan beta-fructosidase
LYVDRSKAGDTTFHSSFAKLNRYEVMLRPQNKKISLRIFYDKSIVEVFANDGEACMTAQLFPEENNNAVELFTTSQAVNFNYVRYREMKSSW